MRASDKLGGVEIKFLAVVGILFLACGAWFIADRSGFVGRQSGALLSGTSRNFCAVAGFTSFSLAAIQRRFSSGFLALPCGDTIPRVCSPCA